MRGSRSFVALVVGVALVAAGCDAEAPQKGSLAHPAEPGASSPATTGSTDGAAAPKGPSGPQTYTVVIDGPSTLGAENFVYGTYFPKALPVRPGDTVVFDNRSSNDVHTVTLGVKSDRSNQPAVILKSGQVNPAVFGPCATTGAPGPTMEACSPPKGAPTTAAASPAPLPAFTGKGYWNSGAVLFASAPPEAGSKKATVKLADDVAPGPYTVTCLLHPFMEATLAVTGADGERTSPADVAAAADKELGEARAVAARLPAPATTPAGKGATVAASWGDKVVTVNRFSPETTSIKVGQTVAWQSLSPYMPHTISFKPPIPNPDAPNALVPAGTRSGGRFAGGVAHSGVFGPTPLYAGTTTFSLTFTKPGTYPYLCILHPGMAGTVQVG